MGMGQGDSEGWQRWGRVVGMGQGHGGVAGMGQIDGAGWQGWGQVYRAGAEGLRQGGGDDINI